MSSRSGLPAPNRRQTIIRSVSEAFDQIERCAELAGDNQELQTLLDTASDTLRRAMRDLRQELSPLGDVHLDEHDFAGSVQRLVLSARQRLGVPVELVIAEGIDPLLPPTRASHVLLFLQEALSNAMLHAGARRMALRVEAEGRRLVIRLSDDGNGFDVTGVRQRAKGGLSVMQQRAEAAGGLIQVESAQGVGTIVTLTLSLRPEHRRQRAWMVLPGVRQDTDCPIGK